MIQEGLGRQAPVKKVQFSKAVPTFASEETHALMRDRDNALERARISDN